MSDFDWQKSILECLRDNGGSVHFHQLAQKNIFFSFALIYLVDHGYVEVYGSKIWSSAMFRLTPKGREEIEK